MKTDLTNSTSHGHNANTVLAAGAPTPNLSTDATALDSVSAMSGSGIGAVSETYLMDCIVGMKEYPDKYFDLAVVDPPYGINADRTHSEGNGWIKRDSRRWDKEPPSIEYFTELFRVSKNQVVWGANHFISRMPYDSSCWLFWDKGQRNFSLADGEMAWTSFKKAVRVFQYSRGKMTNVYKDRFHPTQKPVELYDWIFKNYAESTFKILDTHLGSGSSRIAADKAGLHFVGFEINEEYFYSQEMRFKNHRSQLNLFQK